MLKYFSPIFQRFFYDILLGQYSQSDDIGLNLIHNIAHIYILILVLLLNGNW